MATYSEAAAAALRLGLSQLTIIETVQLYNENIDSLYLVNGDAAITATLEDATSVTFQPINLKVEKPTSDTPEMTITLDATDEVKAWIDAAMATTSTSEVRYRYYLSTDLTSPAETTASVMTIGDMAYTHQYAQIKSQFLNIKTKKAPTLRYTNALSPSLTA